MPTYIVDNQKLDMIDAEYDLYKKIIASYNNGEQLFIDLFQSNDAGIIILLKPPATRHTSMEVFLFLMSLMQQQHIRLMYSQMECICECIGDKMEEIDKKLVSLKKDEPNGNNT